jgi:hypothetical protein
VFEDALAEFDSLGDERWAKVRWRAAARSCVSFRGGSCAQSPRPRTPERPSHALCAHQIASLLPYKTVEAVRRRYTLLEVCVRGGCGP